MNYRRERVQNLIRDELALLIVRELEFEDAIPTITHVEVEKNMGTAKIYVSILPSDKTTDVMKALTKEQGRLQHLLLKKINIKPMPRIQFETDPGPEHAAAVEKILLKGDNQ